MELLVEVKLLEELLLITCHSNMTVSEMSQVALAEYDSSHLNNTPKNVQHVKDSRGRILSGSIKLGGLKDQELFEVILYDESYVQSKILEPHTLKLMFEKWCIFTANQMELYLNVATSDEGALTYDSRDIYNVLDEIKFSKSATVQDHVINCFEMMLNGSRNAMLVKYVAGELHDLFKATLHKSIALKILKVLQKLFGVSKNCLDVEEMMNSVYLKVKTLGCNNEEFLKLCDFNLKDESNTAGIVNPSGTKNEEKEKNNDQFSRQNNGASSPPVTGRMGLGRILELLHSDDSNCRIYALEKLKRCASRHLPYAGKRDEDREAFIDEINGDVEIASLLRALFSSLGKSIKPPGEILSDSKAKVRKPLAYLIADKALHSHDSNFPAILLCVTCIHWVLKTWSSDICTTVLSEKWRILLTLSHANDKSEDDLDITEKCSEMLLLLTNKHGWKKFNIRLEKDSVTYFLCSDRPLMRTLLALSFIQNNYSFDRLQYDSGSHNDNEVRSIFCSGDYANLRSVWRWCIGNYNNDLTARALNVLSSCLVLSDVKSHILKYDPLDKLLSLLENFVNMEMNTMDSQSQDVECTGVIRSALKSIVNLSNSSANSRFINKIDRCLRGTQLGADLLLLCSKDEVIKFYVTVLSNEARFDS